MVTAATYQKAPLFSSAGCLTQLTDLVLAECRAAGWQLQAWAVLANHYHFVAVGEDAADTLGGVIRRVHSKSARLVNALDRTPGRRVWFQYWDTRITFERSYLARLRYVHHNAVHHWVVTLAEDYPWCSAEWFRRIGDPAFVKTVERFKTDRLAIPDDF
jgi:REP-associated tyrosine transposase